MNFRNCLLVSAVVVMSILFIGCQVMRDIPGGHVGVLLTPTGWDGQIRESGQVDIGNLVSGRGNTLILIESTSKTIKETFVNEEDRDDRIYTKDLKMPLNADVYFTFAVNVGDDGRISEKAIKFILSAITPQATSDHRVKKITVSSIYSDLVQPSARGKTRDLFSCYENHNEVLSSQSKISKDIKSTVQTVFADNHVPMSVVNAQLSNVKQDQDIVKAQTQTIAADADVQRINRVGAALRQYPEAKILYVVDAIKNAPQGAVVIINLDGDEHNANIWAAARRSAANAEK